MRHMYFAMQNTYSPLKLLYSPLQDIIIIQLQRYKILSAKPNMHSIFMFFWL